MDLLHDPAVHDHHVPGPFLTEHLTLVAQHGHRLVEHPRRIPAAGPHLLLGGGVQAHISHRLGEEPGVKKMHHRVLGASRVDIDRKPVGGLFGVERAFSS